MSRLYGPRPRRLYGVHSCETKPIPAAPSGTRPGARGPGCGTNKANWPARPEMGAGRGSHEWGCRLRLSRQTNPICPRQVARAAAGANHAKQTQFRREDRPGRWPIMQDKAKLGQNGTSGGGASARPIARNRANSPATPGGTRLGERRPRGVVYKQTQLAGGNRAKQSQFAGDAGWDEAWGTRAAGCSVQTNPISDGHAEGAWFLPRPSPLRPPAFLGPIVQNKPNFGRLAGRRNAHHSTIPSFQHSDFCCVPITTMSVPAY